MDSNDVWHFIKALENPTVILTEADRTFLYKIRNYFNKMEEVENLQVCHIDFLMQIFAERWVQVRDREQDYTFSCQGVNQVWHMLAQKMAGYTQKPLLAILMPSVTAQYTTDNFLRLTDIENPEEIYIDHDNKNWHSVSYLLDYKIERQTVFNLYHFSKPAKRRIITPQELYRLKQKKCLHEMDIWSFISTTMRPAWSLKGEFPVLFLQDLLDLLAAFTPENMEAFIMQRNNIAYLIQHMPYRQAASIYSTNIACGVDPVYLYEILAMCYESPESIQLGLSQLVRWMQAQNPAVIIQNALFKKVYQEDKTGNFYTLSQLQSALHKLESDPNSRLSDMMASLKIKAGIPMVSLHDLVPDLRQIFALRWQQIKDTEDDYFALPNPTNKPWIVLAQTLEGARAIKGSFYQLLVPGLVDCMVPILDVSISLFQPENFILAEDERTLIYLPNSEKHAQSKGSFVYCESLDKTRPFTYKEIARLLRAQPAWHHYAEALWKVENTHFPISKRTVQALHELINNSLFVKGLLAGENNEYNRNELTHAEKAYLKFSEYLHAQCDLSLRECTPVSCENSHTGNLILYRFESDIFYFYKNNRYYLKDIDNHHALKMITGLFDSNTLKKERVLENNPLSAIQRNACVYLLSLMNKKGVLSHIPGLILSHPIEYSNLMAHRIQLDNHLVRFSDVMKKVQNIKSRECVAMYSKYFIKLVLDYNKNSIFVHDITQSKVLGLPKIRSQSEQLIYLDYDRLSIYEIKRRLMVLFMDICLRSFKLPYGSGENVEYMGMRNCVTNTAKIILDGIDHVFLDPGDYKLRYQYQCIMEEVIPNALIKDTKLRAQDTRQWLTLIYNGNIFLNENLMYFHPEKILKHIMIFFKKISLKDSTKLFVRNTIDDLMKKIISQESDMEKWQYGHAILYRFFKNDILLSYCDKFYKNLRKDIHAEAKPYQFFLDYMLFKMQLSQKKESILEIFQKELSIFQDIFQGIDQKKHVTLLSFLAACRHTVQESRKMNAFFMQRILNFLPEQQQFSVTPTLRLHY